MFTIVDKVKLKVGYTRSGYRPCLDYVLSVTGEYVALSGLLSYASSPHPGLHPGLFLMALQAFFPLKYLRNLSSFSMLRKA